MEWQLQDAKAKLSELMQKAIEEGPQAVRWAGPRFRTRPG